MENNNLDLDIEKIFNTNNIEVDSKLKTLMNEDKKIQEEIEIVNKELNTQYDIYLNGEKNIYLTESANREKTVHFSKEFEQELNDSLIQLKMLTESINEKKEEIKKFIEDNDLGSFSTDLLNVKYTSATTTTSIDTAKLKKELPDVAAKYSKVSARSSSISISSKE